MEQEKIPAPEKQNENVNGKEEMVFKDVVTKNKVDKHLSDVEDTISEQDIRNIQTDVTPNTPVNKDDKIANESMADTDPDRDSLLDNARDTGSPWTILNG